MHLITHMNRSDRYTAFIKPLRIRYSFVCHGIVSGGKDKSGG